MMAKTLLDIKDKLIELSKKNSQINDYDNQIEALTYLKIISPHIRNSIPIKEILRTGLPICSYQ